MKPRLWMICASVRPDAAAVFAGWRRAGYRVAALVDGDWPEPENADLIVRVERYPGHAQSINLLADAVAAMADVLIVGADDLHPCQTRSAPELLADFAGRFPGGFGAMHLSKHDLSRGASTDHCWFGADYARRVNGGRGLYHPGYWHYADDTEAGLVAERLGVLWRRPEHGQRHDHWTLSGEPRPQHLERAGAQWPEAMRLFEERRAMGFPGSEPLPARTSTGD